jgi:hypothetical protein
MQSQAAKQLLHSQRRALFLPRRVAPSTFHLYAKLLINLSPQRHVTQLNNSSPSEYDLILDRFSEKLRFDKRLPLRTAASSRSTKAQNVFSLLTHLISPETVNSTHDILKLAFN